MPSKFGSFVERQRHLASLCGLAILVLSPLAFMRALEDAYVLPQRVVALLGLALVFVGLPRLSWNSSRIFHAGLAYFAWRAFTQVSAPDAGPFLSWAVTQLVPLGALVLVALSAGEVQAEQRLLRLSALAVALVSAYALVLLWGWDPWDKGAVDMGFLQRAHGSLGNPDFMAGYLVLALPALSVATLAAGPGDGRSTLLVGLALALVALALFLSQVRAAWLAAALALPLALFAARAQVSGRRLAVALGLALALGAAFSVGGRHNPSGMSPLQRLQQSWSGDGAWSGRRFMSQVALQIANQHPVLGVGPGAFQSAFLQAQGRLLSQREHEAEPYRFTADIHNDWLQVAAESGWPGLALLVLVFVLAWRSAWRRGSWQGPALCGLFTALAVQALFHFPLGIQASALVFWGAVGLCAAWDKSGAAPAVPWGWLSLFFIVGAALTLRQATASAALNSGTVLREQGRVSEALRYFRRATQLWPEDSRAWMRLGLAQDALSQGEESVRSFSQAAVVMPGLPEAWSNLGLALGKLGQLGDAQQASEQALSLNPRSGEAWSNLAKLRYLQGDSAGAIADLEGGIAQAGPSALLYFNLGAVHLNLGQRVQAREAFEQCLRLQPEHAEAKKHLKGLRNAH